MEAERNSLVQGKLFPFIREQNGARSRARRLRRNPARETRDPAVAGAYERSYRLAHATTLGLAAIFSGRSAAELEELRQRLSGKQVA